MAKPIYSAITSLDGYVNDEAGSFDWASNSICWTSGASATAWFTFTTAPETSMKKAVEITDAELALILDALGDATFYRDTRARVLKMAVRRAARRGPRTDNDKEDHQAKARAALWRR